MKKTNIKVSLEQLEHDFWPVYKDTDYLIKDCHEFRKIPLESLNVEQIRVLLGQNIGNKYLIPVAMRKLDNDILVSGDMYSGDLLMSLLTSDAAFWKQERGSWKEVCVLVEKNIVKIETTDLIYTRLKKDILYAFSSFKNI